MVLKNNSDRRWDNYNCGSGVEITIEPNSVFEVKNERAAALLLRNLGAPNWITESDEEVTVIEKPKAEIKAEEKLAKAKLKAEEKAAKLVKVQKEIKEDKVKEEETKK